MGYNATIIKHMENTTQNPNTPPAQQQPAVQNSTPTPLTPAATASVGDSVTPPAQRPSKKSDDVPQASPTGSQAFDLTQTSREVQLGLDYIAESRLEFESMGPQDWINNLITTFEAAKEAIRTLEINNADAILEDFSDAFGENHDYLAREEKNAADFDKASVLYQRGIDLFESYFQKHLEIIETQRSRS